MFVEVLPSMEEEKAEWTLHVTLVCPKMGSLSVELKWLWKGVILVNLPVADL